ncbi:hypothetical protein [Dendronalium sp. ChiSLP03b]|nr:hypothetical protein [Dendronalium sp. ChiSLP03b]MDZ8205766.1 hypothetical protein [Dendronalium sp. ChiSLP03b]
MSVVRRGVGDYSDVLPNGVVPQVEYRSGLGHLGMVHSDRI